MGSKNSVETRPTGPMTLMGSSGFDAKPRGERVAVPLCPLRAAVLDNEPRPAKRSHARRDQGLVSGCTLIFI